MLFETKTVWSRAPEAACDPDSVLVANLLRTRGGGAQVVCGGRDGVLRVLRPSPDGRPEDLVAVLDTRAPILGLAAGLFGSAALYGEPADYAPEPLELAVLHPFSVEFYSPRRSQAGDVSLSLLSSVRLPAHLASFCVAHQCASVLDGDRSKLSLSSTLVVKTLDATLCAIKRSVVALARLGFRYSFPCPMVYNPHTDTLVLSTLEYEVIGVGLEEFVAEHPYSDPGEAEGAAGAEGEARGAGLGARAARPAAVPPEAFRPVTPRWTYCVGERVQQLLSGRYFGSDSQPQGEVAVLTPHSVVWLDPADGRTVTEQKFSDQLLLCAANTRPDPLAQAEQEGQAGARAPRRWRSPRVPSLLLLGAGGEISVLAGGEVRWAAGLSLPDAGLPARDVVLRTPDAPLLEFTSSVGPPRLAERPGLFLAAGRDGGLSALCFGTRGGSGDQRRLLPSITVPKAAVSKLLAEQKRAELDQLRREAQANANTLSDSLCLETKLVGFRVVVGEGTDGRTRFLATYVTITLKCACPLEGCWVTVLPPGRELTETLVSVECTQEALTARFVQGERTRTVALVDPHQGGRRGDEGAPLTCNAIFAVPETVFVAPGPLRICVSGYALPVPVAEATMGEGVASSPYVLSQTVELPIISFGLFAPNPPGVSQEVIGFPITIEVSRPRQLGCLADLLTSEPRLGNAAKKFEQVSPNSIKFIAAGGSFCLISLVANGKIVVSSPAVEALAPALDFLQGYEGLEIARAGCKMPVLTAQIAALFGRCSGARQKLQSTRAQLADAAEIYAETVSKVNAGVFSALADAVPTWCDLSEIDGLQPLLAAGGGRQPGYAEVLDILRAYLATLLQELPQAERRVACLFEKLRGGVMSLLQVCCIRDQSVDGEKRDALLPRLLDLVPRFGTEAHLHYLLRSLLGTDAASLGGVAAPAVPGGGTAADEVTVITEQEFSKVLTSFVSWLRGGVSAKML